MFFWRIFCKYAYHLPFFDKSPRRSHLISYFEKSQYLDLYCFIFVEFMDFLSTAKRKINKRLDITIKRHVYFCSFINIRKGASVSRFIPRPFRIFYVFLTQ